MSFAVVRKKKKKTVCINNRETSNNDDCMQNIDTFYKYIIFQKKKTPKPTQELLPYT